MHCPHASHWSRLNYAKSLAQIWGCAGAFPVSMVLMADCCQPVITSLLLPLGSDPSTDGRLREMLALPECRGACIPDQGWLNLSNTRYLITDKTADLVKDGVFFDTSLSFVLAAKSDDTVVAVEPNFTANAVDVLFSSDTCKLSMDCAPLLNGQAP